MGSYYDKLKKAQREYANSGCNCSINLGDIKNIAISSDGSTATAVQIIYVNCCDHKKDEDKKD